MLTQSIPTFTATIFVGLRERYSGEQHPFSEAVDRIQAYTDAVSWCVTVTPTTFVYKNGREDGVAVGVIDYPRFPTDHQTLRQRSLELAERLRQHFRQLRVSVVFADETVMLSDPEAN